MWRTGATTASDELEAWARRWVPGFRGTWARDAWRLPRRPGTSDIINLDDSKGPGTHWCAVRLLRDRNLVAFFDPFGLAPPSEVTRACWRHGMRILYCNVPYQKLAAPGERRETNCGQRCLAWLFELAAAPNDWTAYRRASEEGA